MQTLGERILDLVFAYGYTHYAMGNSTVGPIYLDNVKLAAQQWKDIEALIKEAKI